MKLISVACGSRYNKVWFNLDFHADSDLVRQCNILPELPFDADAGDAVYSSHFREHLSRDEVDTFIKKCQRVFKSDGILQIVAPDLEKYCPNISKLLRDGKINLVTFL